jgi:hypothetical protein
MGLYYWNSNQRTKAFKYWGKSIEKGTIMGARPELARTYFEVGKHLLDNACKEKKHKGLSAQHYLDLSRKMFVEMDLRWDLDQLDAFCSLPRI